jgi:hypothetical protein
VNLFACEQCGERIYFENSRCEHCGSALGYWSPSNDMFALTEAASDTWTSVAGQSYRYCANAVYAACNWLVAPNETPPHTYCDACALNRTIPDVAVPLNLERWQRLELAKRRLIYSVQRLNLPLANGHDQPHGLLFDFLSGHAEDGHEGPVVTGHADGVITIDVSEADPTVRTDRRQRLGERYRTLLGHFRHEAGHFFFPQLVTADVVAEFRERFGDETSDYAAALTHYYQDGPAANWNERFVTAYASSHPHEDWAETFAHLIHIIDTLDSARAFGVGVAEASTALPLDSYRERDFDRLWAAWLPLTLAVNELNRSVGNDDLYPFVLTATSIDKLHFVHRVVMAQTHC